MMQIFSATPAAANDSRYRAHRKAKRDRANQLVNHSAPIVPAQVKLTATTGLLGAFGAIIRARTR